MSLGDDTRGPFILWLDYGCEGWKPTSCPTLKDALLTERYGNRFVITRPVGFEVVECSPLEAPIAESSRGKDG